MKNLQNAALSSSLIFSVNNHFYVAHSTSKKNQFLWLAVTFMSFIFLRFSISFFGVKETTYRKYRVFFLSLPIIAKITTARNPINSGCVIYGLIHPLSPFVSISSFPLFNVFHSLFSLSLSLQLIGICRINFADYWVSWACFTINGGRERRIHTIA